MILSHAASDDRAVRVPAGSACPKQARIRHRQRVEVCSVLSGGYTLFGIKSLLCPESDSFRHNLAQRTVIGKSA